MSIKVTKIKIQSIWKKNYLVILCIVAAIFIITPIFVYSTYFDSIVSDNNKWGTFGDFFGGVTSPLLSFLGLVALLFTIHLQQKELDFTRKELENSSEELKLSRENAEKQTAHLIRQAKKEDLLNLATNLYYEIDTLWKEQLNESKEASLAAGKFHPIQDPSYNRHVTNIGLLHFYLEKLSDGSTLLTIEIKSKIKYLVRELSERDMVSNECYEFFNKDLDLEKLRQTPWEQL